MASADADGKDKHAVQFVSKGAKATAYLLAEVLAQGYNEPDQVSPDAHHKEGLDAKLVSNLGHIRCKALERAPRMRI